MQCLIGVCGKFLPTKIIIISLMMTLNIHAGSDSSLWTLYVLASGFHLHRHLQGGRQMWLLLFYWTEVRFSLSDWWILLCNLLDAWPPKISKPVWALCFLICMIGIIGVAALWSFVTQSIIRCMWKLLIRCKEMNRYNVNTIKSTAIVDPRYSMKTLSASKKCMFPLEKIEQVPNKI